MPETNLIIGIVAAIVVGGYAAVAWLRSGRDPKTLDDPSILMPAPPPGMTAATATIVDGGGGRMALLAALLDLASRDEIMFAVEGRRGTADLVGIDIHGGENDDARIRLNRRKPIGEGETWLLSQLRIWASMPVGGHRGPDEPPSPEMMRAGMQMFATLMNAGLAAKVGDDLAQMRASREHGLTSQQMPDIGDFAAAYQARTGKQMPDRSRQMFERMQAMSQALSDPGAVAQDPDTFIAMLAHHEGKPVPPEARAQIVQWATNAANAPKPSGEHLPAEQARHFAAPLFFGAFLENYAKRHGWVASLPIWTRLKWHALAVVEVLVGIAIAGAGQAARADALRYAGGGVALGGLVTFLIAPRWPASPRKARPCERSLAAYRRTLKATFAQASSLDQALHRLAPDVARVTGSDAGVGRGAGPAVRHRGAAEAHGEGAGGRLGGCVCPGLVRKPDW